MSLISEFLARNEMKNIRIAVVGDAMVDEYYYVSVKRVSPEFPIPVMLADSLYPDYALPGGAANVAYQLRHFNASVSLNSLMDPQSAKIFQTAGLDVRSGVEMAAGYGHVPRKRRFYSKDFPLVRWDIELPQYGVDGSHLEDYLTKLMGRKFDEDVVILSDYDKGLFSLDFQCNILKSGAITVVDPKSKNIDKWHGCSIFKPNSVEAVALSGETRWEFQCEYFRKRLNCGAVVITQEGDGVVGWSDGKMFEYRPKGRGVRAESVIGAGDCFVAIMSLAVGLGFSVREAAEIAFEAGSLYVRRKHNEPVTPRQLRHKDDPVQAKFVTPRELKGSPGKLVFTNGCFDILHAGHLSTLNFAKSKGDRLVVAVNSDASVSRLKPGRPFTALEDRMRLLASLEIVDYVVSFEEDNPKRLIEEVQPDVLVKGGDYVPQDIIGSDLVEEVYAAPLVADLSTTNLVERIKNS